MSHSGELWQYNALHPNQKNTSLKKTRQIIERGSAMMNGTRAASSQFVYFSHLACIMASPTNRTLVYAVFRAQCVIAFVTYLALLYVHFVLS